MYWLHYYLLLIGPSHSSHPFPSIRLPTDMQVEAIPLILGGGDVLMVRKIYILSLSSNASTLITKHYTVGLEIFV